ncbi:uncharacterized protein LOC106866554 [Brachypodium distachyon]|uniref:SHSP domain-containing protein n=1 Tax=Brachypodium distachyon TaxID=15368 RepID=A0A0Q3JER4_BRADI|nr:uncharacterized protein LOC106866554 [Brachypodium distachyon]KQJ96816.1 hypothetical protein BRADI_3g27262v3 [Brachypodium distachyon]|eukprot:XP_014756822.1 uncharacterized protein LOC106866554 [Brachypodium distachyon]
MDAPAPNATGPGHEDFKPKYTVVTGEPATHTLSVDLTDEGGFKKEHIRVQLVRNKRLVIVSGERPVDGDGKVRRFKLEFQVTDNCDVNGIHARLDGGFVRVTMPDVKAATSAIVVRGGDAASAGKQEPAAPAVAKTDAGAGGGRKKEEEGVPKQKDGAGAAIDGPTGRGYKYLPHQEQRKLATSVVGTVLVLFCLGVYVRYRFGP